MVESMDNSMWDANFRRARESLVRVKCMGNNNRGLVRNESNCSEGIIQPWVHPDPDFVFCIYC